MRMHVLIRGSYPIFPILHDQNILRFQVSVDHFLTVQEPDTIVCKGEWRGGE